MNCKPYSERFCAQINQPGQLVQEPIIDMKKVIYNTQGQLVGETVRDNYVKQFAQQCKPVMAHRVPQRACPGRCDNVLSTDFVDSKFVGHRYFG